MQQCSDYLSSDALRLLTRWSTAAGLRAEPHAPEQRPPPYCRCLLVLLRTYGLFPQT